MAVFLEPSSQAPETSLVFGVILTNICQDEWKDSEISWPKLELWRSVLQELGVSHLGMWPRPEEACFQAQNNLNLLRGRHVGTGRTYSIPALGQRLTWACPSLRHTVLEQVITNRWHSDSQMGGALRVLLSLPTCPDMEGNWAKAESWELSR